ncbi:hypothetical protein N9M68_00485 [Candidatus Poseidonia alphae]|nr:hypothetical protein [Candidatus Poseidonia alphae]
MNWSQKRTMGQAKSDCIHHLSAIGCASWESDPQHPFIRDGRERSNGCDWSGRDTAY